MRTILILALLLLAFDGFAQIPNAPFIMAAQWRCIGPHRGGRTVGAVGVPQQPNVFYIGVNNGGVWKTDDYGRTWSPIFDDQPTGSIGDVAVATSNPEVLYVATGEGIQRPDLSVGEGVFKSTNGGKSWHNTGLRDGLQIGGLAIDPTNENRVFAAVLGHPYGPNTERGVFRTIDGGKSWKKVFFRDENTGAIQVTIDPKNPNTIYADLFETRLAPWENGRWLGEGSGLWKSTDGGDTWLQLTNGLPTPAQGLGRIGFCIAPSNPNRLYATVDCGEGTENGDRYGGIYRSDDAGNSWTRTNADPRLWGRGDDFGEIKCDPKNPDVVYSANVVTWKSTDGGKTWLAWRGAPGGDDSHRMWINPDNPNIILLAGDQGAIVTVNGGRTFSSWYSQPTAQFYHVSTDNAYPYNVYGGQQESGSVGIVSRGNDGQISYREWHPVGVEEWGYVAPDPLDPNIIYGGKITRHDKRTGQTQDISPEAIRTGKYRFIRTAPVMFSPVDPHTLFYAGNVLFKTRNGGHSWQVISPDLSRESYPEIPACVGKYRTAEMRTMRRRGVIYALAPSPLDSNIIWAGTDDGLMHATRDGGTNWINVTPPDIPVWGKISQIDASHFDPKTAYIAVNCIRLDDLRPHIFKTNDGGKTWQQITAGLPENEPINTVREDPIRPGLLYAGTEKAVYFSLDEGANWHSLRLNMPATSIRDLVIKDDDVVVGTHGRSFWILDNITPLRGMDKTALRALENGDAILFKPQLATRVRWNTYTDTPVPQEEPAGQNPPDGAMIDYYLPEKAQGEVELSILNANGQTVGQFCSNGCSYDVSKVNIPLYWIRPQQILSGEAGAHRFCWDMQYFSPLYNSPVSFPIAAVYGNTAPVRTAPYVMPGLYTVRLSVNGKTYEQPLTIRMDPRIKTSMGDLQKQFDLSKKCYLRRVAAMSQMADIAAMLAYTIPPEKAAKNPKAVAKLTALKARLNDLNARKTGEKTFEDIEQMAASLFNTLQESDAPPTQQVIIAVEQLEAEALEDALRNITDNELAALNTALEKAKLPIIDLPRPTFTPPTQHPNTTEPGWELLLSADLSNTIAPKGIWSMTGGELTATEDQCIWTKQKYRDFILDLEFKTADGTNSGVIVHCSDPENWIPNAVEIQIADDYSKDWSKADPTWQCAAIFGHQAAAKRTVKKPGEWNHYTITCRGRDIWVLLNGELVNHMDMNRWLSGTVNPDGSPIPEWMPKPFAVLPLEGHIGFQGKHAGAPIWFRNMRIKAL